MFLGYLIVFAFIQNSKEELCKRDTSMTNTSVSLHWIIKHSNPCMRASLACTTIRVSTSSWSAFRLLMSFSSMLIVVCVSLISANPPGIINSESGDTFANMTRNEARFSLLDSRLMNHF